MDLDDFDMLNLMYPFEYLAAKDLEYYRGCGPVTHGKKKKMRMRGTYLGVW